jgi:hypothetical protein
MKMDKETFIKYHFWYLLGLLVPLIFLALIMLWTSTAGAISAKQADIEKSKKSLEGVFKSEPRNQKWTDALKKKLDAITGQESKNWKSAWEPQADIMTWPPALSETMKDAYFGDRIDSRLRADYTKDDQYASQIDPIIEIVQPVNSRGEGAVQCGGTGNWATFLRTADWSNDPTPSAEEIWLAQEDLWVQRELLRVIREANDSVARLKKLDNPPAVDKAQQEIDHQVFANPTWRIEVALVGEVPKLRLRWQATNVSKQRQVLGINFTVGFRGTKATDTLFLDGEPLGPNQSTEPKDRPLGGQLEIDRPEGVESLTQIFDWRTAPVKRVDQIALGHHSQRLQSRGLKPAPLPFIKAADPKAGAAPAPGAPAAPRGRVPGAPAGGGASQSQNSTDFTEAGLARDRYMEPPTSYVRRMPVGLELVVDQTSIQDVLTAMANAKLRIQITQWHWVRFYGDIKPKIDTMVVQGNEVKPPAAAAPQPATGIGAGGLFANSGPGSGRFRGLPAGGRQAPAAGARAVGQQPRGPRPAMEEQEWQLVELSVYGVASLYERYPPRSPPELEAYKAAAGAKPGTGTKASPSQSPKPGAAPAPTKPAGPPKKT